MVSPISSTESFAEDETKEMTMQLIERLGRNEAPFVAATLSTLLVTGQHMLDDATRTKFAAMVKECVNTNDDLATSIERAKSHYNKFYTRDD